MHAASDPQLKLDALRALQRALGGLGGTAQLPPVYDGYANTSGADLDEMLASLADLQGANQPTVDAGFPAGDSRIDHEWARLFALLSPADPVLAEKVARMITPTSHPVHDIHYLIVLSRFSTVWSPAVRDRVATALVQLDSKLQTRHLQQDRNWDVHMEEVYRQLVHLDPALATAVIEHPSFGSPSHVLFTRGVDPMLRRRAAERVTDYLEQNPDVPWTSDVVFLLAESGIPAHRQLVRQQFADFSLRGSVILALAEKPEGQDRDKFVAGLRSADFNVLRASVRALECLPASEEETYQFALLDALRCLGIDRQECRLRDRVARLLRHNLGQNFGYRSGLVTIDPQSEAVAGWTNYLRQRFPVGAANLFKSSRQQLATLRNMLATVNWDRGKRDRGQSVFQRHSCAGCHNTRTAIGPDLAGVGRRFSRDDLFAALALPNQDVSPRYNTTLIETTRGKVVSGMIVYESADGITLRDSTNQTIRLEANEIAARQELATSLMPSGLLDGLQPQDLADLYAYLRSL